jgi:DNA-binding CsgD family transcriptional regulator
MSDHPYEMEMNELVHGFRRDGIEDAYRCLYCEAAFVEGMVYSVEGGNAEAKMAASLHVERAHGGAFAALLARRTAGLPAAQERVLQLVYEGKSDAEIAQALGGKSASTVRNHRFALRKREAESRALLALMRLLDRKRPDTPRFIQYPTAVAAQDERAMVSETEAKAVESRHVKALPEGGIALTGWPKKQKDKLVLLRLISGLFKEGRRYTEKEVNAILAPVWPDHVTIRRYLIEYRFLDRKADCSEYWRL